MTKLVLSRLVAMAFVLFVVSILVFGLVVLIPGDPAITLAGENPTAEHIAEIREALGLNQPLWRQYVDWVTGVVQLDLGTSFLNSQSVWTAIATRLPVTISLTIVTLAIAIVGGLIAGVLAGLRPGGVIDRMASVGASFGVAVPHFWLGLVLILLFALHVQWLPAGAYVGITENPWEWLRHLFLPAVALGAASAAEIARQARASLSGVMLEDYIRTARAKGLSPVAVVGKHALKNAAVPVVTVIGLQAGRLVGGAVVIEQAFALPGIGGLAYQSVFNRDFPMVQGVVLIAAAMVLAVNLLVDLSYAYFNPKIRRV